MSRKMRFWGLNTNYSLIKAFLLSVLIILIGVNPQRVSADSLADLDFSIHKETCSENTTWDAELPTTLSVDASCEAELMAADPVFAREYEEYLRTLQDPEKKPVLTLYRTVCNETCVRGELWMNGDRICYTLEPPDKNNEKNKSCIPLGNYVCDPYSSRRYPNVWEICDVPDRTYILIHAGNYPKNTKGCVLVGLTQEGNAVGNSRKALELLRKLLGKCSFTLEIKDSPPPTADDDSPLSDS